MDIAHVLRDILIVLVAAKLAAEIAERIGVPAVVGEIVAGIIVGPSLLGFVGADDEVLRTLGEIGVILLLLEVGLEMDLRELGKVGRASMQVATVGVIAPFLLGMGAMELLGFDFETSLFVGAALTATSVGITARVFGDLKALATTEARIVLGAAVADDVMGLVVLTVVVRLVSDGSVEVVSVAGIIFFAVAFLVAGGLAGIWLAPPLFALVERVSRSTGTMVAIALAFTLGFAQLADAARLAPIVGAFVAGIALSRSDQSERVRRELAPVGHLFIPVFFLQIGIDAEIEAFARPAVLRDAAVLLACAIVGKLVSPAGAAGMPGDKLLIGLGMLPRGEVGLIFATIGLQTGVLDDDLYAALLLVVLVTTLASPQLLKHRYSRLRRDSHRVSPPDTEPPAGGWLATVDGEVRLRTQPPDRLALPVALDAAVLAARPSYRPGASLLEWIADLPDGPLPWDGHATDRLFDLVERGNARSWRFVDTTGILDRSLPELAEALRDRGTDAYSLDPVEAYRFPSVERLRTLDPDDPVVGELRGAPHLDWTLLAGLLGDALVERRDRRSVARRIVWRIGLGSDAEEYVADLVADRDLLWSAAHQPGGLAEEAVLQLASYLGTPGRERALYALSALRPDGRERWQVERLRQLHELLQTVLSDPELTGDDARSVVELRQRDAFDAVGSDDAAVRRIEHASRAYLLRQAASMIARQTRLLDPVPGPNDARVRVTPAPKGRWWIDVAARDRPGLLASVTGVLADAALAVDDAVVATWDDGAAIESFRVTGARPDPEALEAAIGSSLSALRLETAPIDDVSITFDDTASPWHTVCEVRSPDRAGRLHAIAAALFASGIRVVALTVASEGDDVIDRFEVTDAKGAKLDSTVEAAVRQHLAEGVTARKRRLGRTLSVR